ncbi:hypothetical protein GOP47_0020833 [Adiantum capillus-veneris]|uniref:Uncharacterized protein n=1 Tax=Adiantum capillus-veneris TaxID=13818 RepID=A0A9D4Z6G5_ADICA|nr:hypothetical protein GOP47_0020833 [Adiantum capillus-veneris]
MPFGGIRSFSCTDPTRYNAHKFVSVRLKRPFGVRPTIPTEPKRTAMLSFVMSFCLVILFDRLLFGARRTPPVASLVPMSNQASGMRPASAIKASLQRLFRP